MAVAAILKIGFLAIIHRSIVRFQRNFVRGSRTACRYGLHDKNCKFLKSKIMIKLGTLHQILNLWQSRDKKTEIFEIQDGGGRHLENRFFGHNSSTDCPISAKFFTRKQNSMSTWQKLQIFKIQDGGQPPFWKWLNRHFLVKNHPILMKLGILHLILNPMTVTWPTIEIFKI